MLPPDKKNPFLPGYGVIPPVLAGRDHLKRRFKERLQDIKDKQSNATATVLMGPRGCGKTVLLEWLQREARKRDLPVVNLASDHITNLGSMAREIEQQFPPNLLQRINTLNLNVGGFGAGVGLAASSQHEESDAFGKWLRVLGCEGGVLLIDEAHNMPPEIGQILYNKAQTIGRHHPLLLVIAGTPDLKLVLGQSHATFVERAQIERIGRLSRADAHQALFEPMQKYVRFTDEAREHVLDEVQNYPYFIQLWGQALWDVLKASPDPRPSMDVVKAARPMVEEKRMELYSGRISELNNSDLLVPIAEMVWRLGKGQEPTRGDFNRVIHHLYSRPGFFLKRSEAEQKVLHTGFIWEPKIGAWEYGIPSLASHVREQAVDLLLEHFRDEGMLPALLALAKSYGPISNQPMTQKKASLEATIKENQGGYVPLTRFQEMGLLIPTPEPGYLQLVAPCLVQRILAKADRLQ